MKFKPFVLFKESKRITKQAKAIFGSDIVNCAGYANFVYQQDMTEWFTEKLKKFKEQENSTGTNLIGKYIDIGGIHVVIKFSNGKIVSFDSSEWGDISEVKEIKNLEE